MENKKHFKSTKLKTKHTKSNGESYEEEYLSTESSVFMDEKRTWKRRLFKRISSVLIVVMPILNILQSILQYADY